MTDLAERFQETTEGYPTLVRVVLPILVVLAGAGAALALVAVKEETEVAEPTRRSHPVEAVEVSRESREVTVHATGRVEAARSVPLEAQVSGEVVWLSEKLRPGGRFRRGDTLLRIDDRDYRVAVRQQEAAVQRAEVRVQQEAGRKEIAEREWRLFDSIETSRQGRSLALREPQMKEARAQLEAARATLGQARLNVERTTIPAPFDLAVRDENVDLGQIVRPGAPVATVVGVHRFWITVSLPVSELPWLEVPGSDALVTLDLSRGETLVRRGRASDVLPAVQAGGMMAQVLVAVEDPLGESLEDESVPLLLGTVADVELRGSEADSVYSIPRAALRRDDTLWLVSDSATLQVVPVDVIHRGPDSLLVRGDLRRRERVVTSMIARPVEGMALEILEADVAGGRSR